jgi:elongation factor Tu
MSTFTRALWRMSRTALRYQKSINPVQQALGIQGGSRYVGAVRNYAAVFERNKPHVNIGQYPYLASSDIYSIDYGFI